MNFNWQQMVFALQFSGQSFYQVKSLSNRVEIASCFQIRLFSHVCKIQCTIICDVQGIPKQKGRCIFQLSGDDAFSRYVECQFPFYAFFHLAFSNLLSERVHYVLSIFPITLQHLERRANIGFTSLSLTCRRIEFVGKSLHNIQLQRKNQSNIVVLV